MPEQQPEKELRSNSTAADSSPDIFLAKEKDANSLSPEEQMALFENDLKENDWGHQPC